MGISLLIFMDYAQKIFRKSQEVSWQLDMYKRKYGILKIQNDQMGRFGCSSVNSPLLQIYCTIHYVVGRFGSRELNDRIRAILGKTDC